MLLLFTIRPRYPNLDVNQLVHAITGSACDHISAEVYLQSLDIYPDEGHPMPTYDQLKQVPIQAHNGFMTDEGSAFPGVAEELDFEHLLDRADFKEQIRTRKHCTNDAKKYYADLRAILDTSDIGTFYNLLSTARTNYTSQLCAKLLDKIENKRQTMCFTWTSKVFTAGHVSDQHAKGGISAMKANGKLKKFLSGASYHQMSEIIS